MGGARAHGQEKGALSAMRSSAIFAALIALAVAGALCTAGDAPKKEPTDAAYAFWAKLLKGPVTPAAWSARPQDPPAVAAARESLAHGFGQVLSRCQWAPGRKNLRIESIDKRDTKAIVLARYVSGANQYIGIVSDQPVHRVRVFFSGGQYQYEVMGSRFAGKSKGHGVLLLPNRVYWLAVFPYKVNGMSLNARPESAKPGDTVAAAVRLTGTTPPGLHGFQVMLVGPDSKPLARFPRYVVAPKGEALVKVTIPADARPGKYGISARCAVTAAIAGDTVDVKAQGEGARGK